MRRVTFAWDIRISLEDVADECGRLPEYITAQIIVLKKSQIEACRISTGLLVYLGSRPILPNGHIDMDGQGHG